MELSGHTVDETTLGETCERYGVASLKVFGSILQDNASPDSDIDVRYTPNDDARLGWHIEDLSDELSELFDRPADLVAKTALHPRPRDTVLSEAAAICSAITFSWQR